MHAEVFLCFFSQRNGLKHFLHHLHCQLIIIYPFDNFDIYLTVVQFFSQEGVHKDKDFHVECRQAMHMACLNLILFNFLN